MAVITVVSIENGAASLSLTVDDVTGDVTSVTFTNNTGRLVQVDVTRPSGAVFTSLRGPGTVVRNLAQNRRFKFADDLLSDWAVSLT